VLNPATRKDLAARTWVVFWYQSKILVLFQIMVQIKQKRGTGVQNPSPRSLWCGHTGSPQRVCSQNYGEPKMGCTKEFVRQTREKQKWIKKPSNQKGRSAVVVLFLNVQVLASSV